MCIRDRFFDFLFSKDKNTVIEKLSDGDEGLTVDGTLVEITYELFIPENMALNLESYSANVTIDTYNGALNLDTTVGNILVNDYNGNVTINTVSGRIDMIVGKASSFSVKSTIGKIYKKGHIPQLIIGEKIVGSFASGNFSDGFHTVSLNTVVGDIYLSN